MSDVSERISKLVSNSGETKTEWAKKLNVTPQFISSLCNGKKEPSSRTIKDICREFDINEEWLRTGEGEMFVPLTRSQEIADFVGEVLKGEEDTFKRRFVAMLSRLDERDWKVLEKMVGEMKKD